MKKIFQYLTVAMIIFQALSINAQSRRPFTIKLDYIPRIIRTPDVRVNLGEKPLSIKDFTDNRTLHKVVVGEHKNRNIQTPSPLDVTTFTGSIFKKCFAEWGGIIKSESPFTLEAEVTTFYATDPYLYHSQVNVLFTLKNDKNEKIWSGVEMGEARVFGTSLSEKNYNEGFSDATREAFIHLFEDDSFITACYGANTTTASASVKTEEPAVPSATILIKKQLVQLVEADFKEDALLAYVKNKSLFADLSADEMIDWKESDIPQSVITEVIKSATPAKKDL
jgi:hypothetical protein